MNYSDIEKFAKELAIKAGSMIKSERAKGSLSQNYKDQHELVTSADIAADKLIIEAIQEKFPHHRIMSEETYTDTSQGKDLAEPIWIIDPIDGTVNYAHGHFMVAVSIAFACEGEVQVGIVYNPFLDECYSAILGQGSYLNQNKLSVSNQDNLRKALIATGFPYDKSTVPEIMRRTEKVLMKCQDIRRLGSAAMDICWVANGRLDGYFESLSPWDFAAARLIALEAGARCGHFTPVPEGIPACIYNNNLLISTPAIYDALDEILD
ncbi:MULTISPECIES: inositol monophosphatase family protein [unclassified Oleiphilus]|jgi:myo-inositol-1(or 4)-monophosphatase|uniref:inositol monophosphatase family protein n=3 Tax=Oleiphilus TaxID=141450 RepID=UPI0007C37178|nr:MULTISPECIES: inositol monophosphatase family protein [unclassified Oleiphilus]KZY42471.1 inositol monophosphatase [Oleiphilus sp. HI0050]KZY79928.1 inositol monophosphatase [Oleiphilus sp. HI0069]KZY87886.1 inositol monophosphatase [Oleiphilus sp. HI0072]KZZ07612.1 inositol monophosphatase [Oleiphilus sp. HI0078]KZZ31231.1 inositol monophosphatase [Oleiphilus sp. HI0085]